MPQLDFATYASQIFWLAVTFGLLYLIMAKAALPNIREVLQNRQTRISDDLKKAEKLKIEAEEAEADFTSVIASSKSKASALLAEARDQADKEAQIRNDKLEATFERQAKDAALRVEVIKKEITEQMSPVIVDTVRDMVKKLINVNVDKAAIDKAVVEQK